MPTAGLPLLLVDQLGFSYETFGRKVEILENVSFKIDRGDYVAIQGPSGSGKSTLFYILGCLLRPSTGRILFDGTDLSQLSDDQASLIRNQHIGFIFQQFHLLPRASVLDNILLPGSYPAELVLPRSAQKAKALAIAERLGLSQHLQHTPNQLSGGQQQRVAIARALLNDVSVLLADEPTGNLDSRNAAEIMTIFDELHAQGRTIIVITHDGEVARRCGKVLQVRDGKVSPAATEASQQLNIPADWTPISDALTATKLPKSWTSSLARLALKSLPGAARNLTRNRAKSLLTMLGIVIGIAAVLAMISLGQFAKNRIMEGYEAMGVNKLVVRGYPNWERKATDETEQTFSGFEWETDLQPLRRIFPEIQLISPVYANYQNTVTAGGRSVSDNVRLRGVNHEYLAITNAQLQSGRMLTPYHVAERARVCLIGSELATQLFQGKPAVGEMITDSVEEQRSFPCTVIGVLKPQQTKQEWAHPNMQILVPYTMFQTVASYWSAKLTAFSVQVKADTDVEIAAKKLKAYFDQRYGKAGRFSIDTEGTLVAQTKRFLNIFATLIAAIAFLSLLVGGIGIHNMMLVSVTERIKEIGLRKALGATSRSIKVQVLMESLVLCTVAGLVGIAAGLGATEMIIFAASKFVSGLAFEWVLDPWAFGISVGSILAVGLFSGMVPAVRAEKLQVIEALRAE
jgi:macrolide transport system ATP-binding/permease protein